MVDWITNLAYNLYLYKKNKKIEFKHRNLLKPDKRHRVKSI